jgi:hypothetical protein
MKNLLWLLLLALALPVWADDAADRAAITQVILALNKAPMPSGLFEENADTSVLDELWRGKAVRARIVATPEIGGPPAVIISHEPWGEARLGGPLPVMEALNPRISAGKVQFVSSDVALADGTFTYTDEGGATQTTPLFFVMKREGMAWKIAAVRRLAPADAKNSAP